MSGNQAARIDARRTGRDEAASWENPVDPASGGRPGVKAMLTPAVVAQFLRRNLRKIVSLAALLFAVGVIVILIIPVKYAATALVIVDPREQRVTTDQEVLPGIGQDAAALQSLIEIAKSDGFLGPLVEKLKVGEDHEIAGDETDPSRVIERFRKHLDISRLGLTYVIAMTFSSKDPQRAAKYANAVAEAFVSNQSQVRTVAADQAADWLNGRLKTLSEKLRLSEDAVAEFKTRYRIVDAGRESTTRQLRVTELTQQVSAARLRAEEAKNRYEQAQRDLKSSVDSSAGSKSDLLTILRAQRTQLNDQIAQKRAVLGDRHPDLVISYNQLAELNRQIETERKRNIASAKSDYETMLDQQKGLEQQLKALEGEMLVDGQAAVKLQELQREADANRSIYEQFLARYNATNQQRLLQASQTKVVSFATPPIRPTRPPLPLLLIGLAVASLLSAPAIVAIRESMAGRSNEPDRVGAAETESAALAAEEVVERSQAPGLVDPGLPVLARIPNLSGPRSLRTWSEEQAKGNDLSGYVGDLLDLIAVVPSRGGKVVLVTSVATGAGKTSVTRALNAAAVHRGLLSVIIEVAPDSKSARASAVSDHHAGSVRALKTSLRSVLRLIGVAPDDPAHNDVRGEFDLVLIDAPSLAEQPEIVEIASRADLNLLVQDGAADPAGIQRARASLAGFGRGPIGIVLNKIEPDKAAGHAEIATKLAS